MDDTSLKKEEKKVDESFPFILSDGRKIHTIEDMAYEIAMMQKPIFECYVNPAKNDIAKWAEETFNEKTLAEKLKKTTDKMLTSRILHNFAAKVNESASDAEMLKGIDLEKPIQNTVEDKNPETDKQNIPEKDVNSSNLCDEKIPQQSLKHNPHSPDKHDSHEDKSTLQKTDMTKDKSEKKQGKGLTFSLKRIFGINPKKQDNNIPSEDSATKQNMDETEADDEYTPEFLKTGVPGFDDLITSGIPKGSSVLLCGGAGTGKTTFSLQVLSYWAQNQKKCLYLTFEEDVSRLKAHMKDFGWDPKKMIDEGYLRIKKMDAFDISRSVEALLAKASGELIIDLDEIEGIVPMGFRPDIIVLDSLSAVSAAFIGKEEGYRIYVEQLFNMFKQLGSTSFLISEVEENTNKYTRTGVEEFLADAVIVFYSLRQKSVRVTALEIIKVRGTQHQKKIAPFKMTPGKGIIVFPKEDPFIE